MHTRSITIGLSCLTTIAVLSACSGPSDKHLTDETGITTSQPPVLLSETITNDQLKALSKRKSTVAQNQGLILEGVDTAMVGDQIASIQVQSSIAHPDLDQVRQEKNTERYQTIASNPIHLTSVEPVSTFSIDVDTGSYANVRRFLNTGQLPPTDAVRVEEMLNYFSYDYAAQATEEVPFSVTTELGTSPWNQDTTLLHVGLKGFNPADSMDQKSNLVFLIDVSGSMSSQNKLGLLKPSIEMLSRQLDSDDRVSIVVYAGASGVVLEPTPGNEHKTITRAIKRLTAGGSTNGQAGIELAYEMAEKNFDKDGVNRVILATDGDFNVGISNIEKLKKLIEKKRESGIALTTLGFGTGNYNDHLMEQLADVGNGNYAYIDTINEARKVLVDELNSTLLTIAHDVKIQIEFNPAVVSEYRLVGYTNRILANEDFNNDKVDAGEIGAGHTVTALYELALVGSDGARHSERRYGTVEKQDLAALSQDELGELRIRFKLPGSKKSELISEIIDLDDLSPSDSTTDNFRFSASVAAFAQALRDSKYLESFTLNDAAALAKSAIGKDEFGYRAELLRLIKVAQSLKGIASSSIDTDDESQG